MPVYQAYRNSTLGHTLEDSLDELIAAGKINQVVAGKIMMLYDRSMNTALANRVKSRVTFKAGKLETYRFFDNTWTLVLSDVEFREIHELAKVDKLKVIACDGRPIPGSAGAGAAATAGASTSATTPALAGEEELAAIME